MKRAIFFSAVVSVAVTAGCSSNNKPSSGWDPNAPVTDIAPAAPPATYQPVGGQQNAYPAPQATAADVSYSSTPTAGATTYVVQRGDTLYKIAREHYGDGKTWPKIAAANPNVTGTLIIPGEKLVLP
jgi:5'-nucleotidase / UDP-sugar diphosphatase